MAVYVFENTFKTISKNNHFKMTLLYTHDLDGASFFYFESRNNNRQSGRNNYPV